MHDGWTCDQKMHKLFFGDLVTHDSLMMHAQPIQQAHISHDCAQ